MLAARVRAFARFRLVHLRRPDVTEPRAIGPLDDRVLLPFDATTNDSRHARSDLLSSCVEFGSRRKSFEL